MTGASSVEPWTRTGPSQRHASGRIDGCRSMRGFGRWSMASSPANVRGKGARAVDVHDARAGLRIRLVARHADAVHAEAIRRPRNAEALAVVHHLQVDARARLFLMRALLRAADRLVVLGRAVV